VVDNSYFSGKWRIIGSIVYGLEKLSKKADNLENLKICVSMLKRKL